MCQHGLPSAGQRRLHRHIHDIYVSPRLCSSGTYQNHRIRQFIEAAARAADTHLLSVDEIEPTSLKRELLVPYVRCAPVVSTDRRIQRDTYQTETNPGRLNTGIKQRRAYHRRYRQRRDHADFETQHGDEGGGAE